jgi:hypothetical protein
MTTQTIAPVSFHALPKNPTPNAEPTVECFNAGLDDNELARLTAPYEKPGQTAAFMVACCGLLPLGLGIAFVLVNFVLVAGGAKSPERMMDLPYWVVLSVLIGLGVFLIGSLLAFHIAAPYRRRFKAWQQSISDTWMSAEGRVVRLNTIPVAVRDEVIVMICSLDEVRHQLKHFNPQGDELDSARKAVHRYILASNIPLLLKQAADAPHIRDRAVRQAAKDYKHAVARQENARQEAENAVELCFALLASHRQARTDAELIRRANEHTEASAR